MTTLIANDPMTLMRSVPKGKRVPQRAIAQPARMYRAPVPAAPPRQIQKNRLIASPRPSQAANKKLLRLAATGVIGGLSRPRFRRTPPPSFAPLLIPEDREGAHPT